MSCPTAKRAKPKNHHDDILLPPDWILCEENEIATLAGVHC